MRIAVSGMPKSDRTLIANALSQLTGIPFLQGRTMYEWSKIYDIASKDDLPWKDIFLISSSALIERIEMESRMTEFVSDGAVFSTLMFLKLTKGHQKGNVPSERDRIMESLENICFGYSARNYDLVVHLESPVQYRMIDETEVFESIFQRRNIPYQIYNSGSPAETLDRIASLSGLSTKMSIENALCIASKNLYISES